MKPIRILLSALLVLATQAALAQGYPTRPVKIVVSYAPGAENDRLARLAAQHLAEQLKQPFVVENKPGAAGVIGSEFVANAPPDGYTLLLGNASTLAIMGSMNPKLPYRPLDFEPVTVLASIPSVLVVNASLPAGNMAEFIALARSKPGLLNYGSPGAGTSMHLTAELFAAQTGTKIVHVAYKGAAPAVTDLLAGQVQFMFQNVPTVLQHVRSGRLRAIAVTTPARIAVLPDVPTLTESGIRDADAVSWFAIVAPKGTPAAITALLQAEIAKAWQKPELRQSLEGLGADPVASTPAEAGAFMQAEYRKWEKAVNVAGLKVPN
ncbi:MAG: tripartite tricarboxylate transporter substrate binding protein [Betaproteobacteria bacterium]